MTAPDYGRAFALWRAAAGAEWEAFITDPFVAGLADGTLPRRCYLHYLVQDYRFLIHFARAWALAAAKAETLDEMKAAAATVHALVHDEMQLHVETCTAEGITPEALAATEEQPETLAYTRYVLEAGYSGDFLDLMAALAPCVLGYGEIGARLLAAGGATPYRVWIETYGGEGYQAVCRDVGALIDGALLRRLGKSFHEVPRFQNLTTHFTRVTRLETGFWAMGLRGS